MPGSPLQRSSFQLSRAGVCSIRPITFLDLHRPYMNMFDVEAGRPIVDRYVISELLDDHLDHIMSVHSAVSYPWLTTLTVHVLQYN